jgi:predicted nucleic acid-binding Zn ribbon protein
VGGTGLRARALTASLFLLPALAALLVAGAPPSPDDAVIDNFSDLNYTSNPAWTPSAGAFTAASGYLSTSGACTSCVISTPRSDTTGQWTFRFNFPGAGDGDDMRMRFYLMSSSSNTASTNGYYVFATSYCCSSNSFSFIRQSGATTLSLGDTTAFDRGSGWNNVEVRRNNLGDWVVLLNGVQWISASDATYTTSSYIGTRHQVLNSSQPVYLDDITFTQAAAPPTVTVTQPNGGEVWHQKGSYTIWWNASAGGLPFKANPTTLYYSTSGSGGPWTVLASGLASSGSYTWNIPAAQATSTNYFIRARVDDNYNPPNVGLDASDAAFTVAVPAAPSVTVTKPTAGEAVTAQAQYTVQYTATQGSFPFAASPITLDYSTDGGTAWTVIASAQSNTGSHAWNAPNAVASNVILRVCANDDRSPPTTGCSQVTFNLVAATPPSTTVQAPNGGETWGMNGTYQIKWAASAGSFPLAANPFTVYVSTAGPSGPWTALASGLSALTYNWQVNVSTSNNSFVRVCAKDDRAAPNLGCDASDSAFEIVSALPPAVAVIAPNGGESLAIGTQFVIRWNATPGTHPLRANPIRIHFSSNGTGGPWSPLVLDIANTGTYSWTVPANATCSAAVRVRAFDDQPTPNVGTDASDSTFCITLGNGAPQVTLLAPAPGSLLRGTVLVEWDGSDVNGDVVGYKVQTSADGGASWVDRATSSHKESPAPARRNLSLDTTTIADFAGYLLRVNATDPNSSSSSSQVSNITVDNTPPASAQDNMTPWVKTPAFTVGWKGADATSGVASYDVLVSVNGSASTPWLQATTKTSEIYSGADGGVYAFTFLATDRAGNREAKGKEDITVTVDSVPPVTKAGPLKPFEDIAGFDLPFTANDKPSQGPVRTELFYRSPSVPSWTSLGVFNSSPARFVPKETGTHEFHALGTDAAGNKETKPAAKEAETFVDAAPPVPSVSTSAGLTRIDPWTFAASAHDNEGLAELRLYLSSSPDNQSYSTSRLVWNRTLSSGPKDHAEPALVSLGSDGYHRVEAYAADLSGKSARGVFTYVRLDTRAPSVVAADPSKAGAPPDARVRIQFDEPMETKSVEAAVKIEGTAVTASNSSWSQGDSLYEFDLKGLPGNTTVKISIGAGALDPAGNALKPYEFSFTTIPTTGSIAGSVADTRKRPITGALVVARGPAGEKTAPTAADGTFTLGDLAPGVYEVSVGAEGFKPAAGQVEVKASQSSRADFILETELSLATIGLYSIAGIVPLAVILAALVLLRRRSRCPNCKAKLRSGRCGNCGYVRAGDAKKAGAPAKPHGKAPPPTLKTVGRKVGPGAATVAAGAAAPPPGMAVPLLQPVEAPRKAVKCVACGFPIPAGEDWCPKCGQAAAASDSESTGCPLCGGGMLEGTCLLCGHTVGGVAEVSEDEGMKRPEAKCPRCGVAILKDSRFCDSCGADLLKIRMGKEPATEQRRPLAPSAPRPPPQLPSAPLTTPAPIAMPPRAPGPAPLPSVPPAGPGDSPAAVKSYCKTCGTPVPPDLPICDVCGEPLGR